MDGNGAVRSVQAADLDHGRRAGREAVVPAPAREPRAHLLALPDPRDARPDPREVHRRRAATSACCSARSSCSASRRPSTRWTTTAASSAGASTRACSSPGRGRGGDGFLEIDVHRCAADEPGKSRLHVEVEVANFYPAIASRLGRWLYTNTQSRIHVLVTHGFLRSLAKLNLAESRVGAATRRVDERPRPRRPPRPTAPAADRWRAATPDPGERPFRPVIQGRSSTTAERRTRAASRGRASRRCGGSCPSAPRMTSDSVVAWPDERKCTPSTTSPSVTPVALKKQSSEATRSSIVSWRSRS